MLFIMNRTMEHIGIACVVAGVCTLCASCATYRCDNSESYRAGLQEIKLMQQADAAHIGVAVEFIRTTKGVDFDTGLREVMRAGTKDETRIYDDQLAALGAQIKAAKRDSLQTCDALLTLQYQYAAVGQQKINFIVKRITGQDSEPPSP